MALSPAAVASPRQLYQGQPSTSAAVIYTAPALNANVTLSSSTTYVNHATWDKYHEKYEDLADEWLDLHSNLIEELVKNYKPTAMKSVQNKVRAIAERAYFDSMDFLPSFKRSAVISDFQWATMCCNHVYEVMDWFATFEKYL